MKFKHDRDAEHWRSPPVIQHGDPHNIAKLQDLIHVIDIFSRLMGEGEVVLTSYYREGDPKYHGKLQAGDLRTKDKSAKWKAAMAHFAKAVRKGDDELQLDFHVELIGTPNEHLHVEVDDNSLSVKRT